MAPASPQRTYTAKALGIAVVAGLLLGISAQVLRQIPGPAMALGGATAPWLTIGFLLAIWATRHSSLDTQTSKKAIATSAVYLVAWLTAYHATFSVRELIKVSDAWREAAPWVLLAGPVSIVLGLGAAHSHRSGIIGDICVALPMAWSVPEIVANLGPDQSYGVSNLAPHWTYALLVALPIAVLALSAIAVIRRREVSPIRVGLALALLSVVGSALLPIVRSVHSFMAMGAPI